MLSALEEGSVIPDVILLDETSRNNLDYLGFKYNLGKDETPFLCMDKKVNYYLNRKINPKTELRTIRRYAARNNIFFYSKNELENNKTIMDKSISLITKNIRESCSISNIISKSAFFPVSLMYIACIKISKGTRHVDKAYKTFLRMQYGIHDFLHCFY